MTKGNTIVTISHDRSSRGKDVIERVRTLERFSNRKKADGERF